MKAFIFIRITLKLVLKYSQFIPSAAGESFWCGYSKKQFSVTLVHPLYYGVRFRDNNLSDRSSNYL